MYKTNVGSFTVESYECWQDILKKIYYERKYIVNYRTIYQVHYNNNMFSAEPIYYHNKVNDNVPLTSRKYGATTMTGTEINKMLGFQLLNDL